MNLNELQRKLLLAARVRSPSDEVPYAFERRVLARLRDFPRRDEWALWAGALWRAALLCVAVMMSIGAWSFLAPKRTALPDLSQDFERTVLASDAAEPAADSL